MWQERQQLKRTDIALVRLEQLYPLPVEQIELTIAKYNCKELIWAQEEPQNMGAWTHLLNRLRHIPLRLISRRASAATASGSPKQATNKQRKIIDEVFK